MSSVDTEQTYPKSQLRNDTYDTKILGVIRDKKRDEIGVTIPAADTQVNKRGIFQKLASIYDPLEIASLVTQYGKIIYREGCDLKIGWDKELPNQLAKKWYNWIKRLDAQIKIPQCNGMFKETINTIELHAFADASNDGVSPVLYAVVHQTSGTNQGSPAHIASKLMENIRRALRKRYITR